MTSILSKITQRKIALVILVAVFAVGFGFAQKSVSEKHVKDIRAEQPPDVILASPLCQRTREKPSSAYHFYEIDPATVEPTLNGLMEKSDVVILGTITDVLHAITPSGEDVVQYVDVRVLRSWKGSQKVGDTLTYALPSAVLDCTPPLVNGKRVAWTTASDATVSGEGTTPHILFLRQSKGSEKLLTPGLRLTGAGGTEGSFTIDLKFGTEGAENCYEFDQVSAERCNTLLELSQAPARLTVYSFSSLKKFAELPISELLQEVQAAADSLGYSPQTETKSELNK
ncbi:MAG: hypothetical protein WAN35_07505 [Terracidiphilus sp.]